MDLTGWSIAFGLLGAAPMAIMKLLRHERPDLAGTVTLFLGVFSLPLAIACIRAAIVGDPKELPSSWRELLAVAGIVTVAMTLWVLKKAYWGVTRGAPSRAVVQTDTGDSES